MNTDLLLPSSDIGKRLADGVQFMESLKKEALDPVTQSMILGAVLGGGTGAGLQRAELSRQKPEIGGETKLDPSSSWLEKQRQLTEEHVRKARSVDHDHPTASTIAALLGGAAVGALGGRKLRAMLKRAAAPSAVPLAARIQAHRIAGTTGGKALNFAANPWAAGAAGAAGLGLAGVAANDDNPVGAGLRGALIGGGLGAGASLAAGALQEHVNSNPTLLRQAQTHAAALKKQQVVPPAPQPTAARAAGPTATVSPQPKPATMPKIKMKLPGGIKLAGATVPGVVADIAGSAGEFLLHTPAARHALTGAAAGGLGGAIASPEDKKRGALVGAALGAGAGGIGGKAIGSSKAYKSYSKSFSKLFRGEAPKVKTFRDLSALHQKVQQLPHRPKGGLGTMAAAGGAGALGGSSLSRKKSPWSSEEAKKTWDDMEHEHGTA